MRHMFFNYDGDLAKVAEVIFGTLELPFQGGDSLNVVNGTYAAASILGFTLKLEENSYDYEDDYNYMLGVRHDACGKLKVSDTTVADFGLVVARILADNAGLAVAIETEVGLDVFRPLG